MKLDRKDIIDIFNFRFATKEFTGEIIPKEDMEMIAETARLSPSSFGLEPWKFLIVENKELIFRSILGISKTSFNNKSYCNCFNKGRK